MALEVGGSSPLGHPTAGTVGRLEGATLAVRPSRSLLRIAYTRWCASSSMAEQRTLNPQVGGSNPPGRTKGRVRSPAPIGSFDDGVDHLTCARRVLTTSLRVLFDTPRPRYGRPGTASPA